MAVADSVCRLVPGVLSDEQCYTGESHWDGLLEYPQYTRPEVWEGRAVPEVLLNGDHARVERWRFRKQLERTRDKRPDMFAKLHYENRDDQKLLEQVRRGRDARKLTEPLTYRPATEADLDDILRIVGDARASLKSARGRSVAGALPAERRLPLRYGAGGVLRDLPRGGDRRLLHALHPG